MTILEIYNNFKNQCEISRKTITEVRKSKYNSDDVLMAVRDLTIKQAFLAVFSEWEHFLENSTIAYSLGEESVCSFRPIKYISPLDIDHAEQLIKGSATYPDWSDMDSVKKTAIRLFKDGQPYTRALNGFSSVFKDIKKVRNVIAHNSIKSQKEFDTVVRNSLRADLVGITPTEFLLSKKNSSPFFYELYITHIENAATIISNYSGETAVTTLEE